MKKLLVSALTTAFLLAGCSSSTPTSSPTSSPTPTPTSSIPSAAPTQGAKQCIVDTPVGQGHMGIPKCADQPGPFPKGIHFSGPPIYGKDVSGYQGFQNIALAHQQGMQFLIAKATEGSSVDGTYAYNRAQAAAAGIPFMAYDFAYDCNSPIYEADHFVSVAGNVQGYILDIETAHCLGNQNAWANSFIAEVHRLTGKTAVIYSYTSFLYNHGLAYGINTGSLHIASYTSSEPSVGEWGLSPMWQYTDAQCAFSYCSDGDIFYGSVAQLNAWLGSSTPPPTVAPPVVNPPVYNPPVVNPPVYNPPSNGCRTVIVRRGDTLSGLFGSNWRTVAARNGIRGTIIYVGQRISYCGGSVAPAPVARGTYRTVRGDTLSGIASRFHVSVNYLVSVNGIRNRNVIYVGQLLRV